MKDFKSFDSAVLLCLAASVADELRRLLKVSGRFQNGSVNPHACFVPSARGNVLRWILAVPQLTVF